MNLIIHFEMLNDFKTKSAVSGAFQGINIAHCWEEEHQPQPFVGEKGYPVRSKRTSLPSLHGIIPHSKSFLEISVEVWKSKLFVPLRDASSQYQQGRLQYPSNLKYPVATNRKNHRHKSRFDNLPKLDMI